MQDSLDKLLDELAIKICENIPLNFTIYENKGFCEKPNEYCRYCREINNNIYLCCKKTNIYAKQFNSV